jgi:D-ribose pyranase
LKQQGLLHSELNKIIAGMGHGDMLVIADNGLPVPPGVRVIDLALSPGLVSFLDVLKAVVPELVIESQIVATELKATNHDLLTQIQQMVNKPCEIVDHVELKRLTERATAIVRTGEWTPYANVILVAGVPF